MEIKSPGLGEKTSHRGYGVSTFENANLEEGTTAPIGWYHDFLKFLLIDQDTNQETK